MMDCIESKPQNRSYFSFRIAKETWAPIVLAVAAYLVTMGIGYLLYPR